MVHSHLTRFFPVLAVIYILERGVMVAYLFAVGEAYVMYFFFAVYLAPPLGLPALAWLHVLHIHIVTVMASAVAVKRAPRFGASDGSPTSMKGR